MRVERTRGGSRRASTSGIDRYWPKITLPVRIESRLQRRFQRSGRVGDVGVNKSQGEVERVVDPSFDIIDTATVRLVIIIRVLMCSVVLYPCRSESGIERR